ncbi:hypothetical protein GCM10010321_42570 [Streptomyces chartreusis]|nr:hypothetical protein GCM10010321_42570 [Streptomyces chartreusis]
MTTEADLKRALVLSCSVKVPVCRSKTAAPAVTPVGTWTDAAALGGRPPGAAAAADPAAPLTSSSATAAARRRRMWCLSQLTFSGQGRTAGQRAGGDTRTLGREEGLRSLTNVRVTAAGAVAWRPWAADAHR